MDIGVVPTCPRKISIQVPVPHLPARLRLTTILGCQLFSGAVGTVRCCSIRYADTLKPVTPGLKLTYACCCALSRREGRDLLNMVEVEPCSRGNRARGPSGLGCELWCTTQTTALSGPPRGGRTKRSRHLVYSGLNRAGVNELAHHTLYCQYYVRTLYY